MIPFSVAWALMMAAYGYGTGVASGAIAFWCVTIVSMAYGEGYAHGKGLEEAKSKQLDRFRVDKIVELSNQIEWLKRGVDPHAAHALPSVSESSPATAPASPSHHP